MQLEFLKNKLELYIPDKLKILGQLYEFYIAGGAITSITLLILIFYHGL
jgi:hypothetical protein